MNVSAIDLKQFCSADPGRGHIAQPWYDPAYDLTIATDGRIMVFVHGKHPQATGDRAHIPRDCPALQIRGFRPGVAMGPLPALPEPEIEICSCCGGKGRVNDLDPEENDGQAEGECPACEGEGSWPKNRAIIVGRALFGECFLREIAKLPGVQFETDPEPAPPFPSSRVSPPASFRFDGGYGVLMPRRP